MKIEQSAVAMNACHEFSSECELKYETETSFRAIFNGMTQAEATPADEGKLQQKQLLLMLQSLIDQMLDLISGNRDSKATDIREVLETDKVAIADRTAARPQRILEMSWETRVTEKISEHESTDFTSTGKVLTADGRSVDFTLELGMCRDFECERTQTEVNTIELRDPLIINFDGKAAELSAKRFEFDLDADGKSESLYGLGASSGYLAFDENADGVINNGSELFGTRSGNGFADLARFDDDGNHWIDESDAAFDRLRIWQRDESGQSTLGTLHDRGIGALYLGSTETPFTLTDDENRTLAQIRASGVYLTEDGRAGTLQQVDLAV